MSASTGVLETDAAVKRDSEKAASSSSITIINKSESSDEDAGFFGVGKQGTYMSFIVLIIGIVVSIIMQRYAPSQIDLSSWENGCPEGYENSCKANSAVLRVSFALTILYALQMIGSLVHPRFFDVLWVPKFIILICVIIGFYFARSEVFGLGGYGWFARITGFLYLILQQIILLDLAYTWNEKWVAYSTDDGEKGKRWLVGILIISAIFYVGSFVMIGLMYWQFNGCSDNLVIISITLCLPIIATLIQTFLSDEGSILTSAIMTAYATYVCYSSVSLNPNLSCNPTIATSYQTLSTVIGLVILVISLVWTTYNSVCKIPVDIGTGQTVDLMSVATGGSKAKAPAGPTTAAAPAPGGRYAVPGMRSLFFQVSLVFTLICGYYAMVLTNWATLQSDDSQSDPRTGRVAMWIQAAGQWVAIIIYLWSLVAPQVLSGRDFGN